MTDTDQREVLEALWFDVHGVSSEWVEALADDGRSHEARCFRKMLDAGAYLDAAMMLVPGGWTLFHLSGPFSDTTCKATIAGCEPPKFKEGEGHTPALALCEAIRASKDAAP